MQHNLFKSNKFSGWKPSIGFPFSNQIKLNKYNQVKKKHHLTLEFQSMQSNYKYAAYIIYSNN